MKEQIINLIMTTIAIHRMYDWETNEAITFCKYVLDGEGIAYTQDELMRYRDGNPDNETLETVKKYALKYANEHEESRKRMSEVYSICDDIIRTNNIFGNFFSAAFNSNENTDDLKPKQSIEIVPGEKVVFKNGTGGINGEQFKDVLNIANFDTSGDKKINLAFQVDVPVDKKDEIEARINEMLAEYQDDIEIKKTR